MYSKKLVTPKMALAPYAARINTFRYHLTFGWGDDLYLKRPLQALNIIIISTCQLSTRFKQCFRSSGVFVASYGADFPAFVEHTTGDGAAETAGCAADDDGFGHDDVKWLIMPFGIGSLEVGVRTGIGVLWDVWD
jgi:hypothetical protein